MDEKIQQRGKVEAPKVSRPTPPQPQPKRKYKGKTMSNNKSNINEGKVVPAKVPQPPVKRMRDGKVVAPKVPRPTPAPSKK